MGESAGLALVPRPSVLAPHRDALWRAMDGDLLDSVCDTEVPPRSEREDGCSQTGLRGARLPTPFLTWLTSGQLNHTAGAHCGLVISPGSLPLLRQGHSPHFELPVGCCQSLWQAGLEEAGCTPLCATSTAGPS